MLDVQQGQVKNVPEDQPISVAFRIIDDHPFNRRDVVGVATVVLRVA
jgi:hypothetical protein